MINFGMLPIGFRLEICANIWGIRYERDIYNRILPKITLVTPKRLKHSVID